MPITLNKVNLKVRDPRKEITDPNAWVDLELLDSTALETIEAAETAAQTAITTARISAVNTVRAAGTAAIASFPEGTLEACEAIVTNFADVYDPEAEYKIGQYCVYQDNLYQCKIAIETPQPSFNSNYWKLITITSSLINQIDKLKNSINNLADSQIFTIYYNDSISATRVSNPIPVSIPKGTYNLKVDSITSDDTSHSSSRITFARGNQSSVSSEDINRVRGCNKQITFSQDVEFLYFYGYTGYDNSAGISFTFNNVLITKDTALNERLSTIENDIDTTNDTLSDIETTFNDQINNLNTKIDNQIDSLNDEIDNQIDGLNDEIDGLGTNIGNIDERLTSVEENMVTVDNTLTMTGKAADAKITGDRINNNLNNINRNTVGIKLLATEQQECLYYKTTISGRQAATDPLQLAAGTYHLKIDSIISEDTQFNFSRIRFYNGNSIVNAYDINRQNGTDRYITLNDSTTTLALYGSRDNSESVGISFTYNNIMISKSTELNERLTQLEKNKERVYINNETISSTTGLYQKTPVNLPAGRYYLKVDSVDSADEQYSTSRIRFFKSASQSGPSEVCYEDINRIEGKEVSLTLARDVGSIAFYAAHDWPGSQGKAFSFNNVYIKSIPESLIENFINPYHDVLFMEDEIVKTTTHVHCEAQFPFTNLLSKNLDAIAISNYYPSKPTYPIEDCLDPNNSDSNIFPLKRTPEEKRIVINQDQLNNIIQIPNAETHGFTNATDYHMNAIGSMIASGKDSKDLLPRGINDTWQNAIIKMKRKLLIEDGGGVTINHPIYSNLLYNKILQVLDFDEVVLGIEIYSGENATEEMPAALRLWDEILKTGRRCWGFAVPDHYLEKEGDNEGANWTGTIKVFVPEKTQSNILKAIRKGAFYCQINHTTFGLENITIDDRKVTITVNENATIKAIIDGVTVDTITGTTQTIIVPENAVYIRFEAIKYDNQNIVDSIYTNPIMFRTRKSIITK